MHSLTVAVSLVGYSNAPLSLPAAEEWELGTTHFTGTEHEPRGARGLFKERREVNPDL